jgi:hypothetical protein
MFQRKRHHSTPGEPRVAPPFMHNSNLGEDLQALLRHFELDRLDALGDGLRRGDPELTGIDARIDACRCALLTVRVACIAIDRASSRGALQG